MKKIIIFAIFIFLIDLISKIIISNILNLNQSISIVKNFFYLTYTNNYGAAFSILQNNRLLLIIVALFVLYLIIIYLNKNKINNNLEILSYSLIIGGLIGNLYDRIVYGYVIDFFDFYIFNHEFAIFNIADSAIVIGIFILIIANIRRNKNENSSRG